MIAARDASRASFTTADAARRWRYCSPELVELFLRDFTAAKLVERVGLDLWRVTPRGDRLARALAQADDREAAA